jgi:DNA-binding transcriptional regulator YhcF (GntR family)
MANWNKMTEQKFKIAKTFLNGGASVDETAEFMNLSRVTVHIINRSENLEEYQTIRSAYDTKSHAKKKAKKEPAPEETKTVNQTVNPTVVRVEATHYMMEEMRKTNELLTAISAKLAAIVSDLYGVK